MRRIPLVAALALAVFSLAALAAWGHEEVQPPPVARPGGPPPPDTGFEGRILCNEEEVSGARVYAYLSYADVVGYRPFAVSEPSADDGTYTLNVPPATYFIVAKKLATGPQDGPLKAGDFFSYQGSNPIQVVGGSYTHVGFILTKKEKDIILEPNADPGSGAIEGVVLYRGQPVEGAVVGLFLDADQNFRGMVYASSPPTGKSGTFRLDTLPQSDFIVIVRKRAASIKPGPLDDGDYSGYFIENPISLKAGQIARIEVDLVSKVGQIVRKGTAFRDTPTQIRGRVLDKEGKPAKGVYAFAYREKVMAHQRPAAISRLVDEKGEYVISLEEGGTYYVGARSKYGEGPGMAEWYGRYDVTPDHSVRIETGQRLEGIDIQVELILP